MPETYDPGQRRPIYGQNRKLADSKWAWSQTEVGKFVIIVGEDNGHGSDVILHHPQPGKLRDVSIKLTDLTLEELDIVKTIFDDAIEWARPVVERRDKEAKDAWDSGDDSHARNYRAVPQLVYRKRPGPEHYQGVLQRPDGVPEGSSTGLDGDEGRVRGAGDGMVEPDSPEAEAEHDGSTTD